MHFGYGVERSSGKRKRVCRELEKAESQCIHAWGEGGVSGGSSHP